MWITVSVFEIVSYCCFVLVSYPLGISGDIFAISAEETHISNATRVRRQACQEFQCSKSSECISNNWVCDGKDDCKDGSDEYEKLCKGMRCAGYLFRCKYGACIDGFRKCDTVIDCKDGSDEDNCPNQNRVIESTCRSDQYECRSGQCITLDKKCDGVADCEDKSDEIRDVCLNFPCPGYLYRCAYGACVNGDAKCNNVKDCLDNSDENDCGISTMFPPFTSDPHAVPKPTPTEEPVDTSDTSSGESCITPPQPENGQWVTLENPNVPGRPGVRVSSSTILKFTCNENYRLLNGLLTGDDRKEDFVLCNNGVFSPSTWPECLQSCPAYTSTSTTTLTCTYKNKVIPCTRAVHNTRLEFSCSPYYEQAPQDTPFRICTNGQWDRAKPECVQACGKQFLATPLLINGKNVKRGAYPWVAALFKIEDGVFTHICGGSLLSLNLVLSAAHCVTDDKGRLYDKSLYRLAIGNYYNIYNDPRDADQAQYQEVKDIFVPEEYRGNTNNYIGDIAILVPRNKFAFSPSVQPVCFLDSLQTLIEPRFGEYGKVTGWGYTNPSGSPSEKLKELDVILRDRRECEKQLPSAFVEQYFQHDKLCAGFFNESKSVCKGDSGGGLVFRNKITSRYFIYGLVSLGPHQDRNNQCDVQQSSLYTNVAKYVRWIQENLATLSRYDD